MSINNRLINTGGLPPQPPGTGALVSTSDVGLVISVDDGLTWSQEGIVSNFATNPQEVVWTGSAFVACADNKIHHSVDGYNWTEVYSQNGSIYVALASNGSITYAASAYNDGYSQFLYINKSTDGGLTWTQKYSNNIGINGGGRGGGISPSGYCHFGFNNGQAYSSNGGETWTAGTTSNGRTPFFGWSNNFWTGYSRREGGIYYSTSATPGTVNNWSLLGGYGSPLTTSGDRIVGNGSTITLFRLTGTGLVQRSTGSASSWSAVSHFTSYPSSQFVYHNGKFIVYYNGNIIGSTNGSTWSTISTPTGYAFYRMASMGKINY